MANKFNVISQEFLNQYRNGDTFASNTTEFTTRLQGNVGEKLQMTEVIEVGTIVNEDEAISMEFLATPETLRAPLLDFYNEGLYPGAVLSIDLLGTTVVGTVENISGSSNQDLVLTSASITALTGAGLVDGDIQSDIVIKVTTVPVFLEYKYGINQNDSTGPRYQSPLDDGEQTYQLQGVSGSILPMVWVGQEIGSSLGSITVVWDSTRETYKHQFTLVHQFLIPYYTEGQLTNMSGQINPKDLLRSNSLKYGNGFWFGGAKNESTMKFEDLGKIGNVGYFGENFNGFEGEYAITDYTVTNASSTGKLEATEANTVTFSITSATAIGFVGSEEIILYHSKLPSSEEYGNSKTAFDTNWITSQVRQTEAVGAVASGVFTAVTVTLNLVTLELDVSAVVTYSAAQQLLLDNDTAASIYLTIATQRTTAPDTVDRSNVVAIAGQTSKDEQVTGLVTNWQPYIYKNAEFDGGIQYTDFDGWDGDLNGQDWVFRTDVTQDALISKMIFRVVADNGTSFFPLYQQSIPIPSVQGTIVDADQFQFLNIDTTGVLNLPTGLLINQIKVNAVIPASSLGYQTWTGSIGFRVPWREWILNTAVPPTFVDYAETNNNLNTKSSNYSGVDSYTIKTVLSIVVQNSSGPDTNYDLLSDASLIADFDVTGTTFTATTKYYDSNNDLVTNLFTNDDTRVEVEFAHTTGTIALGNITGRVWIEPANNIGEPIGELSVDLDFTSGTNALNPTDTLSSGNVTLIEVVTVNNLVTFIYEVDRNNIVDGTSYNVYARIDSI